MEQRDGMTQEFIDHQSENPQEGQKRSRTATEKGEYLRLQKLEDERKVAGAALRKQITKVNSLFEQHQETDVTSLERERDILDLHRERMDEAHQMYFNELRDSKELDQALQWFDTRDREYFQCRRRINEVLQCAEKHISDRMSLVSSRSSKRSSSSIRSKRAKAAARAACLEVEMDFLEREAEYKRLVMLKEIAKAKAEEEAMRKIEEEEENLSAVLKSETLIQDFKQNPAPKIEPVESNTPKYEDNLNPGAPTFVPLRKLDNSQSKGVNAVQSPSVENTGAETPIKTEDLSSVVKLIAEQQQMRLLPVQRPPVFSGNYFDYATFINAFESLIECRVTDPKQRLYYLNQYTAGDAKESIKGLITLDSTDSNEKARKVLKERFGHPYRVAQAYKEKLNSWPAIRKGDGASLQQFSDFLVIVNKQ